MLLRTFAIILILGGNSIYVSSQIIKVDRDWLNTDSARSWQGVIDISMDNVKNTVSIFQLAGSLQISHSWKNAIVLSASNLRLLYEENKALENSAFQHFRYIKTLDSTYSIEGFSQIQFDQLLKIKMRWITGTGLRFTLMNKPFLKLYLRPGYMYEYEQEDSTGIINSHHRMSNYVTLRMKNGQRVKFYFTLFYQPRIDDFSDYRLNPSWTLEFSLIKNLTLSISGDFRYDTRPVEGIDRTTYVLTQGIGWRF